MAIGALKITNSHIAISFSGIAGPLGGTPSKPVGTLCLAIATKKNQCSSEIKQFSGDRKKLKQKFCHYGLIALLKTIKNY